MSIKHIDGFDQFQGQTSAALLASLAAAGYVVSSGLAMAEGRHPSSHALELQVSAGTAGSSWSSRTNTVKFDLNGVAANTAGRWVAVGNNGQATTSTDGIQWAPLVIGTTQTLRDIACNGNTYIAVGDNGTIMRSTNGQAWTQQAAPVAGVALRAVAFGGGKWLAVGQAGSVGAIFVSEDDGATWANITANAGTRPNVSVAFGNARWTVGGMAGQILTAGANLAFVETTMPVAGMVAGVAYTNGSWFALCSGIYRSVDDGANWVLVSANPNGGSALRCIAASGSRLIVGGDLGGVFYSDDGITWTRAAFAGANSSSVLDIALSLGAQAGWCAVGTVPTNNPSGNAIIYMSVAPPTKISRTFVSTANRVVIGFAHRATARGRIFSIANLFNMDWPSGIQILDEIGASVPIRNAWYYYEIVIDKTANTISLHVNDTDDLVVPLPAAGANMTSFVMSWEAENGAVARIDDLYLLDSDTTGGSTQVNRLKPIRVPIRKPTEDVAIAWLGSQPGPHWPLVGLLPPSPETFIRSSTSGDQDLFSSGDTLPEGAGTEDMPIIAVGLVALAQKSDLDNRQLGLVVGAQGNQKEVVDTLLNVTPEYSLAIFETAPGDVPWTAENIETTPFGVAVRP
jgi:hypothetical protein